jgi:NifB/MoaA-like Fe-S oxidoreductase
VLRELGSPLRLSSATRSICWPAAAAARAAYEGFAIAEDGIGLVRRFEDASPARCPEAEAHSGPRGDRGERGMFAPRLVSLLGGSGIDTDTVRVAAVPNDFFGRAIGVAGLLTGRDIQRCLAAQPDLGRAVLVPAVCPARRRRSVSSTIRLPRTWRAISACPCGSWRRRRARSLRAIRDA